MLNQKVSVILPLILTLVLVVVLFFYFNLNIQFFGMKAHHSAQQELLKAYEAMHQNLLPDTAALQKLEQLLSSDPDLKKKYEVVLEYARKGE